MKRENQLVNGGIGIFCFGVLAFLPSLTGRELLILSWLGSWQVPVGISAMVVGATLWVAGKLQEVRNGPVSAAPADPAAPPDLNQPNASAAPAVAPNTIAAARPNILSNQVSSEPADRR